MNLYEQKAAKESELVALKDAIESGDETAIKEGAEIAEALEAINASIAEAETAKAALEAIGTEDEESDVPMEETPKSLGEFAVKSFGEMHRGGAINVTAPGYKAYNDTHTTTDVTEYDKRVADIQIYQPTIRDLLASETISGNSLTYYVMGTTETGESEDPYIGENEKKAQLHFPNTPVTAELQKIAAFIKESDELVEDAPWLKSAIDNRLVTELERNINNYLFGMLMSASGAGSATWAQGGSATDIADAILTEAMTIEQTTGHACNGVIVTGDVYAALRLGKDGDHRYYGGGYWGEQSAATLWGMPVIVIPGSAGLSRVIVGDFSTASMISNTSGIQVSMTNSNENDFIYNRVTVRAERRVALAVRMPQAFTILQEGN